MSTKLYSVRRCLLCGHTAIDQQSQGRWVTTTCPACRAVLSIEFDPLGEPHLTARIERLDEFDDYKTRRLPATKPAERSDLN